jgi:hypothetical protein
MTYPVSPQVVAGTRTLMIALQVLEQQGLSTRLPDVQAGQPLWCRSADAATLVSGGLAAYAPAGTTLRPEPPFTVAQTPGFGAGTTNATP